MGVEPNEPWIRRCDQRTVAALVAVVLVAMAVSWWAHGGPQRDLIEIDAAPERVASFRVDINRADWPELVQLPDVGETLARRIVAHREKVGPYRAPRDLLEVPGIGPKTLERMRPHLLPIDG